MKASALLLACLLALAAALPAREAARVVLGDTAEDCDCPATPTFTPSPPPTATPTASPTATPTAEPTPDLGLQLAIQGLGFPAVWESPGVLLVTLSDESTRFDTAKATLKPESVKRLKALSEVLLRYPGNQLRVDGHTDAIGTRANNLRLSRARAASVREALVGMGVPAEAFAAAEGWGFDRPVGDDRSAEGRALNRRVELRLRFHQLQAGAAGEQWLLPTPTPTAVPGP